TPASSVRSRRSPPPRRRRSTARRRTRAGEPSPNADARSDGSSRCDSMAVAERTRVQLPPGVGDRYEVYVNGVRQEPGCDFDRVGDTLVFRRALAREGRLGPFRWLSMLLGIAGTYRKHESVDVVYETCGRSTVASLEPH